MAQVVLISLQELPHLYHLHVLDGYQWGCQCGESFMSQEAAENCRHCQRYGIANQRVFFTPKP